VFSLIFVVIGLGLLENVVGNYVFNWLLGKELRIFEEIIRLYNSYWMFLAILIAIFLVILLYAWIRQKKAEFRNIWAIYKPVKKLTPGDFKIQKYKQAYINRKSNRLIENLLKNGKYVLITGKPKIGKTRAAYEGTKTIKKLENFSVIKPRPEKIDEIEKIKIPPLSNKNVILFLDDIECFVGRNIDDVIDGLKEKSKKLIVVATSRTGKELDLVKKELPSLYREFTNIELEEISENEGRELAKFAGLHLERFDGTPGTIILDMNDMVERYKEAGDDKNILKSLKLLREGNLFVYRELRVKDVCRNIFELSDEMLRKFNWDRIINNLMENGFITRDEDIIDIYPSYLDECVYDYNPSLRDLRKLKTILTRMGDSGSLFYLGNSFDYKEDFIQAKDCYLEALKIYPKYASAHNNLGNVLLKLGEAEKARGMYDEAVKYYKEAEENFRKAISINPFYPVDHDTLGYVLARLGENKGFKGEHDEATRLYEEAEKEHREAIKLKLNFPSAHQNLGDALANLGRDEEAEEEYRKSIRLNSESPIAHNRLGYVLANNLGREEEAENEYREAIRLKPDYHQARNNLGYLLAKFGKSKEAEEEYREAIKVAPDYVIAYHNLGHTLVALGRSEEAERRYRKALDINPDHVGVHNALGYVLVKLKRYDEAEKEFRAAIRLKPDFAEAHRNLGYLLVKLGDAEKIRTSDKAQRLYKEGEKEHRKALQINSNDEDAIICLGISLERLNRDKEAEDCYKEVIEKNPNNIDAHTTYGYYLSYRGKEEEARMEFVEVIKINPNDDKARSQLMYLHSPPSMIHATRARALIKSGMFDEAEKENREAMILDPNNALTHKNLGILQEERGDRVQSKGDKLRQYGEAEKEYRNALNLNHSYPSAHRHLANVLVKLGRYNEAEGEYEETKKVADNYPKNNRDFGIFLAKIERKEEARKELELAKKIFKQKGNEKEAGELREFLKNL
jgi:Flp pilus assembly protein TadD